MDEGNPLIALIKPQFEAGRKQVARGDGVIRDPEIHRQVLLDVLTYAIQDGYAVRGLLRSPLLGPKGNAEFLAWFSLGFPPCTAGLAPQGAAHFQLPISQRWSKASSHPLPSPEPPHSPITCTTSCRWRGRTSKSTKTTCCQVPSVSLPSTKGTVSEGPSSAARTWE